MDLLQQFWIFTLVTVHLFVSPSSCTDKLFVADAYNGTILLAETDGLSFVKSSFNRLPFTGLELPVGVEFDSRTEIVYWTDASLHTVNRAALNGSMQEVIAQLDPISIPANFEYPYGIALNLDENKVYWADQYHDVIEMADLDGSNRQDLISTGFNTNAAGIVYSTIRRKIFWTEQGPSPKIEMVNPDGTGREVLVDSDLESPNGICLDSAERRLYWTDPTRDRIESIHLDEMTRLSHIELSNLDIHPFGIAKYFEDFYFSDLNFDGVYAADFPDNSLHLVDRYLPTPVEIHIYADTSCPGFNLCDNTGECILTTRQPETKFVCICEPGYTGVYCEQVIDDCASSPCINGSCSDAGVLSYECTCQAGFTGRNCEIDIDSCDPSPCLNGATCVDELLGYACECAVGFTGDTCDEDINECLRSDACGVNEDCTNTIGGFQCECREGSHMRNGECKFSLSVGGAIQFTRINGEDAEFTDELNDPMSNESMTMETRCHKVLHTVIMNIMSTQSSEWDIDITGFSAGSIVAEFEVMIFDSDRNILKDQAIALETSLGLQEPGIWQSADGSVNLNVESVITYGEVCLTVQCVYGTCRTVPGDPNYSCACQTGYTGEYCETVITCPLPDHPLSHVVQPQSVYMPEDLITIECDEKDASVIWRCDGISGEWIQLADLDCQTDGNGLPIGALIGIVAGALFVLIIGMFLCFLYKFVNRKRMNTLITNGVQLNERQNNLAVSHPPMGATGGMPYPCAEGKSLDDPTYASPSDFPSNDYISMYATRIAGSLEKGSRFGTLPAIPKAAPHLPVRHLAPLQMDGAGVEALPPEYSVCDPSASGLAGGEMYESTIRSDNPTNDMMPSPSTVPKNLNHNQFGQASCRATEPFDDYLYMKPY
ncbi:uncharacterized protein LOC757083 isoform X4 [Strongylocentrotus purpuratus]|nr:uncharacterized protein LOC757083 isoform X4 [Strongylocentrotus purpuratus]XP_030852086.1 uncharacterized protein LOC757083 isoform X4 [Strongylocentrotus purpuratus]XP_030852087.1 uncharacterized protein LOC757083 isoform X4 [Strongylocentrotus purpuratus]XP_030852088.1 uncharacterized protein LOC757083 isoform X4 [Strongylocentrotus purpuratus]